MAQSIPKSQFKSRIQESFRLIEQTGEEVVITDHGRPVVKVIPYRIDPEEHLKGLRNTVLKYEDPLDPV